MATRRDTSHHICIHGGVFASGRCRCRSHFVGPQLVHLQMTDRELAHTGYEEHTLARAVFVLRLCKQASRAQGAASPCT